MEKVKELKEADWDSLVAKVASLERELGTCSNKITAFKDKSQINALIDAKIKNNNQDSQSSGGGESTSTSHSGGGESTSTSHSGGGESTSSSTSGGGESTTSSEHSEVTTASGASGEGHGVAVSTHGTFFSQAKDTTQYSWGDFTTHVEGGASHSILGLHTKSIYGAAVDAVFGGEIKIIGTSPILSTLILGGIGLVGRNKAKVENEASAHESPKWTTHLAAFGGQFAMNAAIVGLTWGYAKLVGGAWKAGGWKTAVARGVSNFAGALSDFQIHVSPVGMRMHVGDSYQYHNGDTVTWHAGGKTHTIHGSAWDFLKPGGSSAAALKAKEAAGHGYVLTTEDNGDVKMKANQVLNKITADHGHGPALGDPPPDGSWTTEAVEISLKAGEDPNLEAVIKMDKTGLLIHDKDLVQLWTNEGANPDAKIRLDKENITLEAKGISHLTSKHIYLTADRNLYLDAKSHMTFTSKDLMYISSEKDLHLNADGDFDITTDGTCEINGKKIKIG